MNFKQYLLEKANSHRNEADIVFHHILGNLDYGHVDYDQAKGKASLNIGSLIKNSNYSDLNLVVRKGDKFDVRLGADAANNLAIVVDVPTFPERTEIDSMFSENKEVLAGFRKAFSKYLIRHMAKDGETEFSNKTDVEKKQHVNNKDSFEKAYGIFATMASRALQNYQNQKAELEKQKESTNDEGRKHVLDMALENLKDTVFGKSHKELLNNVLAKSQELDGYYKHMEGEFRKKFESRVEHFFDAKIKTL
jgi:hypothetical protein